MPKRAAGVRLKSAVKTPLRFMIHSVSRRPYGAYSPRKRMTADIKEFDAEMQQQKQRARNAAAVETRRLDYIAGRYNRIRRLRLYGIRTSILRYRQIMPEEPDIVPDCTDKPRSMPKAAVRWRYRCIGERIRNN